MSGPRISVIVPTCRRPDALATAVRSIFWITPLPIQPAAPAASAGIGSRLLEAAAPASGPSGLSPRVVV